MAGDVHVWIRWIRWLLHVAAPAVAAAGREWRILLPFSLVLLIWCVWFWLPKLLVRILSRVSRRYVKHSSSGPSEFVSTADGESKDPMWAVAASLVCSIFTTFNTDMV